MEITKATTMGEMLQYDMGIAYVLMEAGMHRRSLRRLNNRNLDARLNFG